MSLKNLPLEVIDQIHNLIDFDDLKTLRLVSKSLNNIVTPRVFSSVAIWLQKDSIKILRGISRQEHLRHYVKHIRVAFDLFIVNDGDVKITPCRESRACENSDDCDCQVLTDKEYRQVRRDWAWISKAGAGVELLGKALSGLPNMQAITVGGQIPEYAQDHPRIFFGSTIYRSNSYLDYRYWWNNSGDDQYRFLLAGIAKAGEAINLRCLASINDSATFDETKAECMQEVYCGGIVAPSYSLDLAKKALQRVEKLEWESDYPHWSAVSDTNHHLQTMSNLQDIRITDSSGGAFHVKDLFSGITLNKLYFLRFENLQVDCPELLEVIARHAETLKTLELRNCRILGHGHGADVFDGPLKGFPQHMRSIRRGEIVQILWHFDKR